jgi:Cu+-exporting ATPase
MVEAVQDAGYGAALAPERHSAVREQEEHDRREEAEYRSLRLRAGAALAAGAAAMLTMHHAHMASVRWALLLLTLSAMGWAGRRFYLKAWAAVRHGAADMNVLIALGTGSAFLYSAAVTMAPGFFAARGLPAEVYYEGVLFILGFILTDFRRVARPGRSRAPGRARGAQRRGVGVAAGVARPGRPAAGKAGRTIRRRRNRGSRSERGGRIHADR